MTGIAIKADAGAPDANSFITEADFIAYLATRLNVPSGSTVTGPTCSEDEKKAMIEATRDLNAPAYTGERASATQALAWPRVWAPNPDAPTTLIDPERFIPIGTAQVVYFGEDEIPQRVKDATCELALQYRKAGTTDLASQDPKIGILSETVDVLSTDYAPVAERAKGLARFPRVLERIQPLLRRGATSGIPVVRL